MKKHFTLAFLSAITFVGGSWLAAQQSELDRPSRSLDAVAPTSPLALPSPPQPPQATQVTKPSHPAGATRGSINTSRFDPYSQRPAVATVQEVPAREVPFYRAATSGMAFQFAVPFEMGPMSPEEAARMRAFQDAIRELRGAENEDDKAEAREEVTKLVSEQLDADLASREKELVAIEQRALQLRKQLDERKTAKPELLKMLVMLIDNPQVGLGIPPQWMQMLMRGQPNQRQELGPGRLDDLEVAP